MATQPPTRHHLAARRPLFSAAIAVILLGAPGADSAENKLAARTGVLVTPRHFPKHTLEDVADMFRLNAELGSFAVVRVDWKDSNRGQAAHALMGLAERHHLDVALELSPFKADGLKGARIDPPEEVAKAAGRRPSFTNPDVAEAFSQAVLDLAELQPASLAVATDVNLLYLSDPREYEALAGIYSRLYPRIRQKSPRTEVYVSFQWEAMQGRHAGAARDRIESFRPHLDMLSFNSDPHRLFDEADPGGVPADYYTRMAGHRSGQVPVFVNVGWPSGGKAGESEQAAFIRGLPRLLSSLEPDRLAWTFLHDVRVLRLFTARLGLLGSDGRPKPAFSAFRELGDDRPSPVVGTAGAITTPPFAIFTARRDGGDLKVLASSPDREMSHPRVSPDGSRVVLTRYNKRGRDGRATEEQGYEETEILMLNLDGTGLETIVPARAGIIAANGGWAPDGKSLIFISTDTPGRAPEIRRIDLASRRITRFPTPPGLPASDPHWEAGKLVFPVKELKGKGGDALWMMNADGSEARPLTRPPRTKKAPGFYGDFDPRLSPDGTRIAFMRIDGGEGWKVMVLDLATGAETLLTPKGRLQGLPTWSSDGARLLYVQYDRRRLDQMGLYTMTPDGEDRRRIPLPRGYLYGHSSFFPGDGSSETARIIFNGRLTPGL